MTALELLQSGQPYKALPLLARKAKKEPTLPHLLALSSAQRGCCQFDAAEETLARCIELTKGKSPEVWNNLAQVFTDRGKFTDAPIVFQRALQEAQQIGMTGPDLQQILLGMAYSLMRLGQFEYSWEAFDAGRLGVSWAPLPMTRAWRGEKDKRVLIVTEGGFGDAFLFSRWIPKVCEVSDKVGLLIWDKLLDFCDWKRFGVQEVLPLRGSVRAADWDYTISIMSLPGIFGMKSMADVPPDLMFDAFMETIPTHERLPRVQHNPLRIGLCWRAEETGSVRKIRSLDDLTAGVVAKELAKVGENGCVLSLCPSGKALHKHDTFRVSPRVIQDEESMHTWHMTAQYILSMDLVVSVDTAVFHLAGLLGVPTLLLLPCRSDWKYGLRQFGSDVQSQFGPPIEGVPQDLDPWYGDHVTYYRERSPEGWTKDAIVDAVRQKLLALQPQPANAVSN